jgi:hypothetical protein
VSFEFGFGTESVIARFTPNAALVFGHMVFERYQVFKNLAADSAGRIACVKVQVVFAQSLIAVRLLAHTANEPGSAFNSLSLRKNPRRRIRCQGIACK